MYNTEFSNKNCWLSSVWYHQIVQYGFYLAGKSTKLTILGFPDKSSLYAWFNGPKHINIMSLPNQGMSP